MCTSKEKEREEKTKKEEESLERTELGVAATRGTGIVVAVAIKGLPVVVVSQE